MVSSIWAAAEGAAPARGVDERVAGWDCGVVERRILRGVSPTAVSRDVLSVPRLSVARTLGYFALCFACDHGGVNAGTTTSFVKNRVKLGTVTQNNVLHLHQGPFSAYHHHHHPLGLGFPVQGPAASGHSPGGGLRAALHSAAAAAATCTMIITCAACDKPILDKFLLNVLDRAWHAECVRCYDCNANLTEKCFSREGKLFCRNDFFRLFIT
ncbi:hypothetical protein B566_EDAN004833 [Ephemera danica]|nr:hypothetical protein B566_EDAN004833 [Ephemera danica]